MRALEALCRRYFWLAAASTFLAGSLAGWVRLLPWLSAPQLPLAALVPFVIQLAVGAAQAAALLAAPLGAALAALIANERGEARALFALGVSPERCARALGTALLGPVLGVALGIAGARAVRDDAPVEALIRTSDAIRERCLVALEPIALPIPGTDFTWLCERTAEPLLVGLAPGSDGQLWVSGRTLELAAGGLSIQDAQLRFAGASVRSPTLTPGATLDDVAIELKVERFTLRNAFDAAPALPSFDSFAAALAGASLGGLVLAAGLLRRERIPRWLALSLALAVGCSALMMLGWLQGRGPAPAGRLGAVVLSIAAPLLSAAAARGVDSAWQRLARSGPGGNVVQRSVRWLLRRESRPR